MKPNLIVICGATATGKSGLALKLAQKLNTIIISADSRQVYREFDIGTAKPTLAEQNIVPHYMIDICNPTEILTLAEYQEQSQNILNPLINKNSAPPLLVGGTGLYIKSIVKGLKIPRVSPQPELRSQLETMSQKERYKMLAQIDAIAANKIHFNDSVRTIRALEVYYVTGKPISEQQGENPPPYRICQIGLDCDAELLQERIRKRIGVMIDLGLEQEVENLGKQYGWGLPLLDTLGYAEIKQYLVGDISLAKAKDLIALHTRQFAKRQRTWFKANPEIQWFNANDPDLANQVGNYLSSSGN
jgi:tRNA dimethylallyltransferase